MMAKRKTTVYLDEAIWRAAKVAAARRGQPEYQIVEEALRRYLGLEGVETIQARSDLGEEEALELAYREVHEARKRP